MLSMKAIAILLLTFSISTLICEIVVDYNLLDVLYLGALMFFIFKMHRINDTK